jgi:regulator of protease activity HflC (stomatin/prohibitin superfamily)
MIFSILWGLGLLTTIGCAALACSNIFRKRATVVALVAFASTFLTGAVYTVPAGHVGIKARFSQVNDKVLQPGIHLIVPYIDSVTVLDNRVKSRPVDSPPCKSKDLQLVHTVISVQHCLEAEHAPRGYRAVGNLESFDAVVISPAVFEASRAVIGRYTSSELIHQREKVKTEIEEAIQQQVDHILSEKDLKGALVICNVSIKDFDFSPEFNNSIESSMTAAQQALQKDSARRESNILADAQAQKSNLLAEGDAYSTNAISVAKAAAIEREANALKEGAAILLQYRTLSTWDGQLPRVLTQPGSIQNVPALAAPTPAPAAAPAGK